MLLKGRLTLGDLVRFTSLPAKQVRECLVVLIQHGITYFSESPEGKNEPTYYTTDAERILMRLRMGSILRDVYDRFGTEVMNLFLEKQSKAVYLSYVFLTVSGSNCL
jgi:DNA-directed RNA polymerase III subunit RPC3